MICTDADHYVNTLSNIKKQKKIIIIINWGTKLKKSCFIYEGLVTIFINDLHGT